MIKSLGKYEFPSKSRQELYGDDILLHLIRKDTMFFCAPATFRAPKAMKWSEFLEGMALPFLTSDPDFDKSKDLSWTLVGEAFTPDPDKSLEENGIQHKNAIAVIGA